ncbi:PepSY-like domain-containing protein [Mucilaginibacter sp. RB4R14]|uniref:PepSY-like domain-containing protein n=1 Tax=Mucilaginibacter aurantiaciroseus TaxID=2949308 RepID=UPI0020907719|nr:PepSY-like domain-containing protein [Mucilaginibacter aurantiaciroseus]MCO5937135.1 PepSY-like domain-containing protein [Mucilaginibacter aurantiaciroseus]
MKLIKTTAAILIATSLGITVMAQKLNSAKVPAAVKTSFEKAYPGIKAVKWEKEKGDFEAGFKQGNNEMSAVFKADGAQVESELEINAATLPATVIVYLKQHYKGAIIKEAAKITKANGEINYEAEVNGKDLLFDSAGKFIKIAQD